MAKVNNHDSLGDRMKEFYEHRTRFMLPRKTYGIIRVDGKAFHTLTRGMDKPFSYIFIDGMNTTAHYMCENIQGAKFGFVQSDEISVVFTDIGEIGTDMWFDGNIQKICSISAALATARFNAFCNINIDLNKKSLPLFDARVFIVPSKEEVLNYFIWRQNDASRNSLSAVAQSLYSAKELNGMGTKEQMDMIVAKGQNWNGYPTGQKRGRAIIKVQKEMVSQKGENFMRAKWEVDNEIPLLTKDGEYLLKHLP
jgi:tRNA(His) 5'-end guanylyltransferase